MSTPTISEVVEAAAARGPDAPLPKSLRAGRMGVRLIAVWEAAKGVLVLLVAGVAVWFLHPDAVAALDKLAGQLHLDPTGHLAQAFQRAAENLDDKHLMLVALGAGVYALLHFVEAYGLWRQRRWGWMLGIASAGIYLPVEIWELLHHPTWTSAGVLTLNIAIIVVLWFNRVQHVPTALPPAKADKWPVQD